MKDKCDERLESLSDKVRKGISIEINEALEVIKYQARAKSLLTKIKEWWRFS